MFNPFISFRRRGAAGPLDHPNGENGSGHQNHDSHRPHHKGRRPSGGETAEQKVTRMVRTSLDFNEFSEVLNLQNHESKLALQVTTEMIESPESPSSSQEAITTLTRNRLRVLSWSLALKNNILPESLFLEDVKCVDAESRYSAGFADVFCGTYRGERVALKRLRVYVVSKESQRSKLRQACYRESLLWKTLDHKYILPFLGVSEDAFEHTSCIVLPWIKGGNIIQCLDGLRVQGKASGQELLTTINQWLYEISQGLAYLHGEGIIHGDLRGANILINSEGSACLTNFDLAAVADTAYLDDIFTQAGPTRWRCPELLDPEHFKLETSQLTFPSDIYSFGCTAVELYTSQPPYAELHSDHQVHLKVINGYRPKRPFVSNGTQMSDHLWALTAWCWAERPNDRPSVTQVVQTMALVCPKSELPSTLFLEGVQCLEKESLTGGGFADIFVGEYEGKKVALKRLRLYQKTEEWKKLRAKKAFYRETLIWSTLKHRHILPFLGVDATNFKHSLCMVLPWMDNGNIRDCIKELKENNRFHNGVVRVTIWLEQIADGISFLHSKSYVHGDLRGANILIDEDLNVRLADFGLAVVAEPTTGSYRSSSGGAIRWLPPELLDPEHFGFTSSRPTYAGDVWALGCVCLEIHTCRDPFFGSTDHRVLQRVVEGKRPLRPVNYETDGGIISDALWDLCCRCWREKPENRPTAETLVEDIRKELDLLGVPRQA